MKRTPLVLGLAACLWTTLACAQATSPAAPASPQAPAAARQLAQDAVIVDTHIDAPENLMQHWADLGEAAPKAEFDYPKARAGGLDVAFMSIYTSAAQDEDGSAWQVANQMIDAIEALAARHPDRFALLRSPGDVARLRAGGRVLLPLGMENGAPLEEDLSRVQHFYDRGVRYITLAHSAANRIADSSYGTARRWNGLSPFGRQVVAEMNRLGIMVDVSHLSDASAAAAIRASRAPVIASHSAFRQLTPGFERNISDALARQVAKGGGVVQVPFGTVFVDPRAAASTQAHYHAREALKARNAVHAANGEPLEDRAAFEAEWSRTHPAPETRIDAVLDQVMHGVRLLGAEHVGIGSDFDGVDGELPAELRTAADYPHLVAGLQARGLTEAQIRGILGGNLLRVWTAVEQCAQSGACARPATTGK